MAFCDPVQLEVYSGPENVAKETPHVDVKEHTMFTIPSEAANLKDAFRS